MDRIQNHSRKRNMRFLYIGWVSLHSVSAMYRHELRHLPEKHRQERIQKTVLLTFDRIQSMVIQTAATNQTHFQFTLYCIEPNIAQRGIRGSLYLPSGDKYILSPKVIHLSQDVLPLIPRPRCENQYGYELYQNWNRYGPDLYYKEDKEIHQVIVNAYPNTPLEDSPLIYIQRFFEQFNQAFPDIRLEVSERRPSSGIFDAECCPIYNVSW